MAQGQPLVQVTESVFFVSPGERKRQFWESLHTLRTQDNGLLADWTLKRFDISSRGQREVSLSLCGLVLLVAARQPAPDLQWKPYSDAGTLLPMGVKMPEKIESFNRLTRFEASTTSLCRPVPGIRFEFTEYFETEVNSFLSTKKSQASFKHVCDAAAAELAASTLHTALRGNYLPVRCSRTADNSTQWLDYAFLLDTGIYLLLNIKNSAVLDIRSLYAEFVY